MNIFGDSVITSFKVKNMKKWPRPHVEARKTCGFLPDIPC